MKYLVLMKSVAAEKQGCVIALLKNELHEGSIALVVSSFNIRCQRFSEQLSIAFGCGLDIDARFGGTRRKPPPTVEEILAFAEERKNEFETLFIISDDEVLDEIPDALGVTALLGMYPDLRPRQDNPVIIAMEEKVGRMLMDVEPE